MLYASQNFRNGLAAQQFSSRQDMKSLTSIQDVSRFSNHPLNSGRDNAFVLKLEMFKTPDYLLPKDIK